MMRNLLKLIKIFMLQFCVNIIASFLLFSFLFMLFLIFFGPARGINYDFNLIGYAMLFYFFTSPPAIMLIAYTLHFMAMRKVTTNVIPYIFMVFLIPFAIKTTYVLIKHLSFLWEIMMQITNVFYILFGSTRPPMS